MAKVSVGEFIQQVRAEAAKITWPTGRETVMTAVFVFMMTAILALFFFALDSAFGAIVRQLLALVSGQG